MWWIPRTPRPGWPRWSRWSRCAGWLEDSQVEQAMRAGWSWSDVAEVLGVTRQAVHKKHAKRLIAAGVALRRR